MGGPPRFEVGDTMIHPPTSDLVASCSPHVQRTWGTHSTTPPFLYTLLGRSATRERRSYVYEDRRLRCAEGLPGR